MISIPRRSKRYRNIGSKTSGNKGLLSWDEVDLSLGDEVRVLKDHTELQRKWFTGIIFCVW